MYCLDLFCGACGSPARELTSKFPYFGRPVLEAPFFLNLHYRPQSRGVIGLLELHYRPQSRGVIGLNKAGILMLIPRAFLDIGLLGS